MKIRLHEDNAGNLFLLPAGSETAVRVWQTADMYSDCRLWRDWIDDVDPGDLVPASEMAGVPVVASYCTVEDRVRTDTWDVGPTPMGSAAEMYTGFIKDSGPSLRGKDDL